MKTKISDWLIKTWRSGSRYWPMLALALAALPDTSALAGATVTTLTDSHHGHAGYKNGNTLASAQFRKPAGITLDSTGKYLLVADYKNNAVRLITEVGSSDASYTYTPFNKADGISRPLSVAIDSNTNIIVLNQADGKKGTLMKFSGSLLFDYWTKYPLGTIATNLKGAVAMALDNAGNAYITVEGNKVIKVTPAGVKSDVGIINVAGTSLHGIVVMLDGRLAITDVGNHGIWIMDPANTNLTANSTQFTGFHGADDVLGPPTIAAFNRPENLAKAGNNILVVTDFGNNQVKTIDANGNVNVLYGINKKYWTRPYPGWRDGTMQQGIVTVQARQPYGLTIANDGTVYVTEDYYNLLRMATGTGLPALPPPPPAAPVILSAITNLDPVLLTASVTLNWTPVNGATNYYVKRSENPGGPYASLVGTSDTTYTDTDVVSGKTYYYVVSAANASGEGPNSSEVSVLIPYAPVEKPQIGYIDSSGNFQAVPGDYGIADNDLHIIIKGVTGSTIYYTNVTTDGVITNSHTDSIAGGYTDDKDYHPYLIDPQQAPYMTVKAHASKGGSYPDSQEVQATFQFRVADPSIPSSSTNYYDFTIKEKTDNAQLYYTLDGSDPRTNGSDLSLFATFSPSNNVWRVRFTQPISSNVTFKVWALRPNYQASGVVTNTFYYEQAVANTISFGFDSGPGSSKLVASPGQSFLLPVSLSLLEGAPPIYGLQFNITVTNLGNNAVAPGAVDFGSMVGKPSPFADGYYVPIPNLMFISTNKPNNDPNAIYYNSNGWYQSLTLTTSNSQNLLGVGWLEVYGRNNLYDTLSQNLLSHPLTDGIDLTTSESQVVIGSYSFEIPTNAIGSDVYQVRIQRPSATTFPAIGYGLPVVIDARANTNLVGPGSINALKNITIGQIKYLVGNVYPANWYNAGDFGSGDLINIDVMRVFDFAAYPIAHPPETSDLFDALDSCGNFGALSEFGYYTNSAAYPYLTNFIGAVTNYTYTYDTNSVIVDTSTTITDYASLIYMTTYFVNVPYYITNIYAAPPSTNVVQTNYVIDVVPGVNTLFNADDTAINQIAFGDGVLDVCDVYVTFRRSLDPSLTWYERFWTNSVRVADTDVTNHFAASKALPVAAKTTAQTLNVSTSSVPPLVVFTAGAVHGTPGQTVQVPITASIAGDYPLRVLLMNISVVPVGDAPQVATPVQFSQTAATLGTPYATDSIGNGNYAAVWLDSGNAGLTGDVTIGNLSVTIPASAPANAVYGVFFDHVSASPNGLASFPCQKTSGLIDCSGTP